MAAVFYFSKILKDAADKYNLFSLKRKVFFVCVGGGGGGHRGLNKLFHS